MDAAAGPLVRARHDLDRGRPDRALAALDHVTGYELETAEFWRVRAAASYRLQRYREAVEAARRGLEQAPDDLHLLEVLALASSELRQKSDAVAAIDAAIALYPNEPVLHAQKAVVLARNARNAIGFASYGKARAAANDALRLDPDSLPALKARAQVALLAGERRAHVFAERVLSLEPDSDQGHRLAGSPLANRGRATAGLEHYAEAARLDPEHPEAARLLRATRPLRHPIAFPLRLFWRLGPIPVLLTIFVLVVAFLVLFLLTGIEAPLAVAALLFLPFYWYLTIWGTILRFERTYR